MSIIEELMAVQLIELYRQWVAEGKPTRGGEQDGAHDQPQAAEGAA